MNELRAVPAIYLREVDEELTSDSGSSLAAVQVAELPSFLACVLDSKTFEKSPTLRALLRYLWQFRDEPISEYAVATGALGRSSLFNAKTDATVRVQISRLRQRLDKYYEQEGSTCSERLVIPLGTHHVRVVPVGRNLPVPVFEPPAALGEALTPSHWPRTLSIVGALLLVTCFALAWALLKGRTTAAATPEIPRFWKAFFRGSKPTRIILPTPVFFSFRRNGSDDTVMVRDTNVNEFGNPQRSAIAALVGNTKAGLPSLAQSYTVTSDTFASVKLVRYLDGAHLETAVRGSAASPMEALDAENVIALGTSGTLTPLKPYLDQMNFFLGPREQWVEDRHATPGHPRRIERVAESAQRIIWPGVIANLPGRNGKTHLLILASLHTSALVSFLTSTAGLDQLEQIWKANGSPEYYEVVVNSEMNGDDLVRFWPVTLRPFQVTERN